MRPSRFCVSVVMVFAGLMAAPAVRAQVPYGINDEGGMVGGIRWLLADFYLEDRGFVYDGTRFMNIRAPGPPWPPVINTTTYGINDTGEIVGVRSNFTDPPSGFLLLEGVFTNILPPGAISSAAYGINDHGQVVGTFSDGAAQHGFVKDGPTYTTFDVPGSTSFEPHGINDAGLIVGSFVYGGGVRGFLKDGSTYRTLDAPGSIRTEAWGINDAGEIVGFFQDAAFHVHGFVTDGTIYTTLEVPGSDGTQAFGINDAGQIVGSFSGGHPQGYEDNLGWPHFFDGGAFRTDGVAYTILDLPFFVDEPDPVSSLIVATLGIGALTLGRTVVDRRRSRVRHGRFLVISPTMDKSVANLHATRGEASEDRAGP